MAGLGPVNRALGLQAYTAAEIGLATTVLSLGLMVAGSLLFPDKREVHG